MSDQPGTPPPAPAPAPEPPATPPAGDPPPPAPAAGAQDDYTPPSREEWQAAQEELNRARQAAARGDRARRDAERQRQQQAGEFEELYNAERQRVEAVTGALGQTAVRDAVAEAAQRLRFRNPAVAHGLLLGSNGLAGIEAEVDLEGPANGAPIASVPQAARTLIEQRLARLAESDPYLLADVSPRQLPGAGQTPPGGQPSGNAQINAELRRAAGRA